MTVQDYIQERFLILGLPAVESLLFDVGSKLCKKGITLKDDATCHNVEDLQREFVKTLPMILLSPQSISELGVSITMAKREDIIRYYRMQCKALGLKDELREQEAEEEQKAKAKIRFL